MTTANLRIVRDDSTLIIPRPSGDDPALRPQCFDDYVGQHEVVDVLREAILAAKRGGWQLDHVLLTGPAGYGKTTLSQIIANELGGRLHVTSAPAIEHKGTLASLLTALAEGDVLFIDEIHALDTKIAETLYSALEDRVLDMAAGKRVIRIPLPKFTLVGATTHAGKLAAPFRDRFGLCCQLRSYTLPEMQEIVARSARKLGVEIDVDGAIAVGRAARSTPRIANRLLRRVRDAAANAAARGALVPRGTRLGITSCTTSNPVCTINGPLAAQALAKLGIDALGLDALDRRYLAIVADRPVGIEAICAELAEARSTIEEVVEPFLMQAGLIRRGGRGRVATESGREHLAEVA